MARGQERSPRRRRSRGIQERMEQSGNGTKRAVTLPLPLQLSLSGTGRLCHNPSREKPPTSQARAGRKTRARTSHPAPKTPRRKPDGSRDSGQRTRRKASGHPDFHCSHTGNSSLHGSQAPQKIPQTSLNIPFGPGFTRTVLPSLSSMPAVSCRCPHTARTGFLLTMNLR